MGTRSKQNIDIWIIQWLESRLVLLSEGIQSVTSEIVWHMVMSDWQTNRPFLKDQMSSLTQHWAHRRPHPSMDKLLHPKPRQILRWCLYSQIILQLPTSQTWLVTSFFANLLMSHRHEWYRIKSTLLRPLPRTSSTSCPFFRLQCAADNGCIVASLLWFIWLSCQQFLRSFKSIWNTWRTTIINWRCSFSKYQSRHRSSAFTCCKKCWRRYKYLGWNRLSIFPRWKSR